MHREAHRRRRREYLRPCLARSLFRKEYPELLVGAGTVLTAEQVEAVIAAVASFAVTPGFNPGSSTPASPRVFPSCPESIPRARSRRPWNRVTGLVEPDLSTPADIPANNSRLP